MSTTLSFIDAVRIAYPADVGTRYEHAATRRAQLFNASLRMLDRARGTLSAAKLCACDGDFKTLSYRAAHQIDCANRLQEWAVNNHKRGGL